MEVVSSLPNVLKVFPLRIMGRNEIPAHQQLVDCPDEVEAPNPDEEMEEGEIDAREQGYVFRNQQLFFNCNESVPRAHFFLSEAQQAASALSAEPCSPPLSVMTNTLQLERSVDALLKLSSQGQIRFRIEQTFSESPFTPKNEHLASSPAKKQQGFSPSKQVLASSPAKISQRGSCLQQAQAAALLRASSLVQQYSSQSKAESLPPNISAAVEQIRARVPPQVPSPPSSPIKPTEASFLTKKLQDSPPQLAPTAEVTCPSGDSTAQTKRRTLTAEASPLSTISPQSKHPPFTPTPEVSISKSSSPQAEQPGQASLNSKEFHSLLQLSPPAYSYSRTSPSLQAEQPQAAFPVDNSFCTGTYEVPSPLNSIGSMEYSNSSEVRHPLLASSTRALTGIQHNPDEALSLLELPCQPPHPFKYIGSVSEKTLCDLGMNKIHCPVSNGKASITCANGKTRIRSSAIRDYPEGCGKNVSLQGIKVLAQPKPSILGDKVVLKTHTVKKNISPVDRVLSASVKQVRKEKNLAGCQEAYPHSQGIMMDERGTLCLYKAPKTSALFIKRQKVKVSSKRKKDARSPRDPLLHKANKKIRYMSWILDSTNEDPSFSTSIEQRLQTAWVEDENHEHVIREINKTQGRKKLYEDPSFSTSSEQRLQTAWVEDDNHEHVPTSDKSIKLKGGKSYMERPSGVMYAKQVSKPSGDLGHPSSIDDHSGASARALVKRTLQEFDFVRRSLAARQDRHHRPDLAAAKILKTKKRWRNCGDEKIVGDVPGVEVGDQFSFRIEMLIIGLHRQCQGGIDYIAGSKRLGGPLATSIVASGGYEDDDDCGETFIYTGQGGNNYKGDRRQACDQVLARGNLALSNSCKERSPVRVIRGSTDDKFYTYDGLYNVVDCWFQTGAAGFGVFQFKLSRRPGQPELVYSIVRFMGTVKKKGLARPHLLMGDISHGKEVLPICVVNEVDEELAPPYFTYVPKMKYADWYSPDLPEGCDCVGGCVDASKCLCAARNGGEFPYNEFGQIVTDKKVVFECGKSCACSSLCHNRVSQRGPRHQLEVFKTRRRGWGVRSLEPIRPASLICEYVGELLSDSEAEQRVDCDEYLFDISNKINAWSDASELMDKTMEKAIVPIVEDAGYTIDARLHGNVARFINHSCSPNLFAQNVVYDNDDLRFPHVMLFSAENIPPMRELSYDYNYTIGHVNDRNGDVKSKPCYCGAQDCRGRLY